MPRYSVASSKRFTCAIRGCISTPRTRGSCGANCARTIWGSASHERDTVPDEYKKKRRVRGLFIGSTSKALSSDQPHLFCKRCLCQGKLWLRLRRKSASCCQDYCDVPSCCNLRSAFMCSPSSCDVLKS